VKVAFDISPLKTASGVRGIGSYTQNLLNSLQQCQESISVTTFSDEKIQDADLIHYPYFDFFSHTLPIIRTKPRIITIHDVIPLIFRDHYPLGIKGIYRLLLQKIALKNADAVICDSSTSMQDIHKTLGYPLGKIFVVYLAPAPVFKKIQNVKYLNDTRKKYKLPINYFLFVGDVNWNKNIPGLLNAVKETGIHLVMVGNALVDKTLPQVQEIDKEIKNLKIDKRITKTGFVPQQDLCAIYNLASATIVPSFYEGFGLPLVESMACATPVLCSNNSSLTEIGGKAAIYFDPSKEHDIAKTINTFLSKSMTERQRISKISQDHASKYSWSKVARDTINVYKSVLGQ